MGRQIGYARVSTGEQDTAGQRQALVAAGCAIVYEDVESGASRTRPELKRCLDTLREGDALVVHRLDRLARSVPHLYEIMEDLQRRKITFRSLRESFDTATPSGRLMLGMLTAIAQFERELIHDQSTAGIAAAKERGVLFGNPGMRTRDPAAIAMMKAGQADAYLKRARDMSRPWIEMVRRLRPATTWANVHHYICTKLPPEQVPTQGAMVAAVRRLVRAGDLPGEVLGRAPAPSAGSTAELARQIAAENPGMSLRALGRELHARGVTPLRADRWSAQTISQLLERAS